MSILMAFKQSKVSDLEVKMSMLNYDRVLWRRMFEGQSRWHLSVRNRWELARWAVCFTSTIDVVISHNMCCWFFSLVFFFFFFLAAVAMSCVFVFLQCPSISQFWRMEHWHITYRSRKVRTMNHSLLTHPLSAHTHSLFTSHSLLVALTLQ